jgi:tetratricopeptide (TPR) repeat protein
MLASVLSVAAAQNPRTAQVLEQAGQFEQAFEEYRLAVNANSSDLSSFQGLVRLSGRLGRYDTLAAVSLRLAKARPEQADFALGAVEAQFGLKRPAEALAELRRTAKTWPARVPDLADIAARWQEYGQAASLLQQARAAVHDDLLYAERLVEIYGRQGQFIPAAREIVAILNRQSEALGAYGQKLSAYAGKADTRALISELDKIAAPEVRARAQATVYLALGKDAEAVRTLKPVLGDQELYQLARELETEGRPAAALLIYEQQQAHADAARMLRRLGRDKEALAELALDSGTGAQFELAELYRAQHDYRAAADAYDRVLRRQPNHEPALFGLASAQMGTGSLTQARATARRVSRPTDRVLLLLAETFFYDGMFDSAQAQVQALVRQYPRSVLVNDGLEFAVLIGESSKDESGLRELSRAMLDCEIGAVAAGADLAGKLAEGSGAVAERAALLRAQIYRRAGRPKDALAALEEFPRRFAGSPLRAKAKLEQACLLRDDLKDESKFRETLEALVLAYPGSAYVPIARSLLAESARPVSPADIR